MIIKDLYGIYRIISRHPLAKRQKLKALGRFLKWQLTRRLLPFPMIYPFVNGTKLILAKGQSSATGQYYMGLSELEEMTFVLHFLREDDLFVDVGANVGCFTLLASGVVRAQSIAVEPLPETFDFLHKNIKINNLEERVDALNIGLADKNGTLHFTQNTSQNNHVARAGDTNTVTVPVSTLDAILFEKQPVALKIDVEGFESAVLEGAKETLKKQSLCALIIELVGLGARYGYDERQIQIMLEELGFSKYNYDPFSRSLTPADKLGYHNTIYLRDPKFTEDRVRNAPFFTVLGQQI